ncbi:MAG: inositol monophosphatase [Francisellaceae bacterium]|nr:inositol monophosphatase [Francisellaceae bacterium]
MHPYLNIAIKAARKAGIILIRHLDRIDTLKIYQKGHNDFVTLADKESEESIIDTILQAYPDHAILGEESGNSGESDHQWVIDPLDGTFNYVHGIPNFAISIAIKYRDVVEHGVIFNPITDELFTVSKGIGVQLNGYRLRASPALSLDGALISAGLPEQQHTYLDGSLKAIKILIESGSSIRRLGSATLALAYLAAGRIDGFWALNLKEWDIAAGALMIREARGFITDFKGSSDFQEGNIIAGSRKVYGPLLKILEDSGLK